MGCMVRVIHPQVTGHVVYVAIVIKISRYQTIPPTYVTLNTGVSQPNKRSAFISEECCRHKLSYHHKIYFSVTIKICEQRVRDHTRSDQLRTNLLCCHDKLATLDFHFTLGEHEEYIGISDQLNILRVKLTSCPARTFGVGDQFHVF